MLGVTALNFQSGSKGVRQSKKSHSTLLRVKSPLSNGSGTHVGLRGGCWELGGMGDSTGAAFAAAAASSLNEPQEAACGKTNFLKSD